MRALSSMESRAIWNSRQPGSTLKLTIATPSGASRSAITRISDSRSGSGIQE